MFFLFLFQAKAIALTVAQAFNVAFEMWEVRNPEYRKRIL